MVFFEGGVVREGSGSSSVCLFYFDTRRCSREDFFFHLSISCNMTGHCPKLN